MLAVKPYLYHFDKYMTRQVGRLPAKFQPGLIWLGRFTTPLLWLSAFTVLHVAWLTPGALNRGALAVVLLLPLASVIKLFFRRHRPATIYAQAMKVKSFSFPSSHAYSAALAGGYLVLEAVTSGNVFVAVMLLLLIGLIGFSRVHVGAHYPSDVVAGWALGGGLVWVAELFS